MRPLIVELRRTCYLCPEQWEGKLDTGEAVFARERHDVWRVEVDGVVIDRGSLNEGGVGSAYEALLKWFDIAPDAEKEDE